jgi:hypothetical protein
MKHLIAILLTLQFTTSFLIADETSFSQVKELLVLIENTKQDNQRDAYSFATIREWRQSQEFKQLEEAFSKNWEEILKNIKEVAPSDTHQLILFNAYDALPQKDALQCLNKILDLRLRNGISEDAFDLFMGYSDNTLGNKTTLEEAIPVDKDSIFLALEVFRKLKIVFADEPETIKSLDASISKIKKRGGPNLWLYVGIPLCLLVIFYFMRKRKFPITREK